MNWTLSCELQYISVCMNILLKRASIRNRLTILCCWLKKRCFCTPDGNNSTIALAVSKTFLAQQLFNASVIGLVQHLKGDMLYQVMEKFLPFCSPNIQNMILTFQHHPGNKGYIDNILLLKSTSTYDYIQYSYFLGQLFGQKVFLFKMFLDSAKCGVDLVQQM